MSFLLLLYLLVLKPYLSSAGSCNTRFSEAPFIREFALTASSEAPKNKASDVFTVGWCSATSNGSPQLEVDFKQSYGISSILISGPTNRNYSDPYPTNVLVKYVPNGGDLNTFVHFPLQEGKLEIKMTEHAVVQSNFGTGIAVRKLQFTLENFHGDPCLNIDLMGCTINDLCSGGCQNGGTCIMQDTCQCQQGFVGNNCEQKACMPQDLGLADGRIGADHIQVSSQDAVYNKAELGNSGSKKGWCPSVTDRSPWVQITLDEPKAVKTFSFMWSEKRNSQIMTEFELQFIAPIDSSRQFRTFATDIPALNGTHIFTVTVEPVVVTDTIRIIPSKWDGLPCFKLEIKDCDPKSLCSAGWCQNGGTCMGENECLCPSGFVGSRCELTTNEITVTNMTFVKTEHNVITTTTPTLQFLTTGNVQLKTIENKPVVTINGSNSCMYLNKTSGTPSCMTDVNLCKDGFTFTIDVNFGHLLDNTYILSSGGHLPGHSGIELYYTHKQLIFKVGTTTQVWTLVVRYQPVLHKWQQFELTWNKQLGVGLLMDGRFVGTSSRPAKQAETIATTDLSIGCSQYSPNVDIDMQVKGLNMWPLDRTELVNAGVKDAPKTTPLPSTATTDTVAETTTARATFSTKPSNVATTMSTLSRTETTKSSSALTSNVYEHTMSTESSSAHNFMFDDAVSAKCTSYGWNISMNLDILKLLYPGITAEDIFLSSEKCNGTLQSNKLRFQQDFSTCMTRKEVVDGTEVFQNVLFYAEFDPIDSALVRHHYWTYNIACYVSTGEATSSHLHHEVESHSTNITAHHGIALTFFKDKNFFHQLSGNPLRVTVGDNIYVKVSTSVQDWDTKMRLHSCYTKSSDSAINEHVLIRDGCEVDSSTHIISQSTHETKFVFRDFEYLTLNEGLDVYCNATFCDTGDYSLSCTQTCRKSPPIVG